MPKTREVDITPDVSLFKKVGSQPYRIPDAVAELVDNEIDAAVPGEKLTVNVAVRMGKSPYIVVEGNGRGMTPEVAADALRMAHSSKTAEQIGEFGLGMKAACSNLGKQFELVTCTADADSATRVFYDEDEFLKTATWTIKLEQVEKPFPHGTRITITKTKVNIYAGLKDTVVGAFGRIFKHFLTDGQVEIFVNSDPVTPEEPRLLDEYTKPFSFELHGHSVRGWYGLLEKSSQVGGYGFELIRHKRAMRRYEKIGFKPHPRLARLTGEIHLDSFPVTNNKMDFVRDTEEWRELDKMIGNLMTEIRGIASKMASKKLDQKDLAQIEDARAEVQEALNSNAFQATIQRRALDELLTQQEEAEDGEFAATEVEHRQSANGHHKANESKDEPQRRRTPRLTEERFRKVKAVLPGLEVEHDVVSLGDDAPYKRWDVTALSPVVRITVGTNLDHPMYSEVSEDLVLWVKHNIVEAAAEYLAQNLGINDMLMFKSDILKHIGRLRLHEMTAAPTLD